MLEKMFLTHFKDSFPQYTSDKIDMLQVISEHTLGIFTAIYYMVEQIVKLKFYFHRKR